MQTIKNIHYDIERVENSTYCTMKGDLSYILSTLEHSTIKVGGSKSNIKFAISPSQEMKVFTKNLANWGFTLENPTITVVAKITLHKDDEDNQEIANRIVRDKARATMCAIVMYALNLATFSTIERLERLGRIYDKLRDITLVSHNYDLKSDI